MVYKIREGLVRETVCGKELLIATLQAREHCPFLTELNEASAFIWDLLESGISTEEIVEKAMEKNGISKSSAETAVLSFISELERTSFIFPEQ